MTFRELYAPDRFHPWPVGSSSISARGQVAAAQARARAIERVRAMREKLREESAAAEMENPPRLLKNQTQWLREAAVAKAQARACAARTQPQLEPTAIRAALRPEAQPGLERSTAALLCSAPPGSALRLVLTPWSVFLHLPYMAGGDDSAPQGGAI